MLLLTNSGKRQDLTCVVCVNYRIVQYISVFLNNLGKFRSILVATPTCMIDKLFVGKKNLGPLVYILSGIMM